METKTDKESYILDTIDRAITELVYEKSQIIKAYNYYHGKRDPEQFRHLEENYGIGTPTSVEFIPLVRKHVDVLIGEYLSAPLLPKVSCKDSETLHNIFKDKQAKINNEVALQLRQHLLRVLYSNIEERQIPDKEMEMKLEDLKDSIERNFISDYEIAGQNIVDWSMQSRSIDFANQRKVLLTDLLVSGMAYYKVYPSPNKTNVLLKVLNPINTFIDRNPESPYLKNSARAVVREFLTKDQILARYGEFLKKDDLEELETLEDFATDGSTTTYLRSYDSTVGGIESDGILGGFEVTPLLPFERNTSRHFKVFPCYEVEWLRTEKENGEYIVNRYEGVRIGNSIYIPKGKAENVIRSIDDSKNATLTVNGLFYSDRNGDPFSLLLKTANLQDKNDVLHFYRDNVISESGSTGDWLDVAHLPKFLGTDLPERLMKWKAYKKTGIALIDSSQEGNQMANTTFGGYDDTIKLQTIQAIDLAIQRNEETCSMITGVFREKLGGIEQRDAVTNVQVGVKQSSYITKQYYQIMDLITREILLDILDLSKIVYKNGISGTLILGEKLNQIFTALPEHYTVTDFDIHITDSSEIIKEQETIKQFGLELTKGGQVDPEVLIEIITASGLTKMKESVKTSMAKKKAENDQLGQLNEQVQQLDQELKQSVQEAQKLQAEVKQLNAQKLQLEREKLDFEKQLEWYKARTDNSYKDQLIELQNKRVQLEGLQLFDNNAKNDEIRDY